MEEYYPWSLCEVRGFLFMTRNKIILPFLLIFALVGIIALNIYLPNSDSASVNHHSSDQSSFTQKSSSVLWQSMKSYVTTKLLKGSSAEGKDFSSSSSSASMRHQILNREKNRQEIIFTEQKNDSRGSKQKNLDNQIEFSEEAEMDGDFQGQFDIRLPEGYLHQDYCLYLTPQWGRAPYSWVMAGGLLPPGLSLDTQNGMLCGVPEKTGFSTFNIRIGDVTGNFILIHYSLLIMEAAEAQTADDMKLLTEELPSSFVGQEYFTQLMATGGTRPYQWNISSLPENLSYDAAFGVIYGVPEQEGRFNIPIQLTGADQSAVTQSLELNVKTSPLYITSQELPIGVVGTEYFYQMQAQGGIPPYSWKIIGGQLTNGLIFDPQFGVVNGNPGVEEQSKIKFQVIDQAGSTDIVELNLIVSGAELSVITEEVNSGRVGETYYQQLEAQGGVPEYHWVMDEGELPSGIQLQPPGILVGTPLSSFSQQVLLSVEDQAGNRKQKNYLIEISSANLEIVTDPIQELSLGRAVQFDLNAIGGYPPYVWSMNAGNFPDGLTLQEVGQINGVPQATGVFNVSIDVQDQQENITIKDFTFIVEDQEVVILSPTELLCNINEPISYELQVEGGISPYEWRLADGHFPEGIVLYQQGLIEGVSSEVGIFPVNIEVKDSLGNTDLLYTSMNCADGDIIILPVQMPDVIIGAEYHYQCQAQGGLSPYEWSIVAGGLPLGIELNPLDGTIEGTAEQSGQFSGLIQVEDTLGQIKTASFEFQVEGETLTIIEDALSVGTVGNDYLEQLQAQGGTPPYIWQIASGELPIGLIIDSSTGEVRGNPSLQGDYSFQVKVRDQNNVEDMQSFMISVNPAQLMIETDTLEQGHVDQNYDVYLEAVGGIPPFRWSILSGELADGLLLDENQGRISGMPTETVENIIHFQVKDSADQIAQKQVLLSVAGNEGEPVTNLIAQGSDRKIGLAWTNPNHPQYDHTVIVRNTSHYPQNVDDGTIVYSGTANNKVDMNCVNDRTYYYSAFAVNEDDTILQPADDGKKTAMPHAVSLQGAYQPFVNELIDFSPLDPENAAGSQHLPSIVFGPPKGSGEWIGSVDVVSLHAAINDNQGTSGQYGGSITLKFNDAIVVNAEGVDFTIFENAFRSYGTDFYWIEPAIVEVSFNGVDYYRFPFDFVPHYDNNGNLDLGNPFSYAYGFAGKSPVFSLNNDPDPRNPSVSGGDSFDLNNLAEKPSWIQYIRIISTGDNWLQDVNGDFVRHSHRAPTWGASGTGNSGFDLDAVCAVNY